MSQSLIILARHFPKEELRDVLMSDLWPMSALGYDARWPLKTFGPVEDEFAIN